jgi:serine/threonine protein kinase
MIDKHIKSLIKKIETNMDVSLVKDVLWYEGKGEYAEVYRIEEYPLVIRIGTPRERINDVLIQKLIDKPLDNVVKIYYYHYNEKKNIELVVMETLDVLDEEIESILYNIEMFYSDGVIYFLKHADLDGSYDEIYESLFNVLPSEETQEDDEEEYMYIKQQLVNDIIENKEILNQLYMGFIELENMGIHHTDLHMGNIMQDDEGNIKIIDFF